MNNNTDKLDILKNQQKTKFSQHQKEIRIKKNEQREANIRYQNKNCEDTLKKIRSLIKPSVQRPTMSFKPKESYMKVNPFPKEEILISTSNDKFNVSVMKDSTMKETPIEDNFHHDFDDLDRDEPIKSESEFKFLNEIVKTNVENTQISLLDSGKKDSMELDFFDSPKPKISESPKKIEFASGEKSQVKKPKTERKQYLPDSYEISDNSWTFKYQPKDLSQFKGNSNAVTSLRSWYNSFKNHEGKAKRAVMIIGPPCVGKRSFVLAFANEMNAMVRVFSEHQIESNTDPSDKDNKKKKKKSNFSPTKMFAMEIEASVSTKSYSNTGMRRFKENGLNDIVDTQFDFRKSEKDLNQFILIDHPESNGYQKSFWKFFSKDNSIIQPFKEGISKTQKASKKTSRYGVKSYVVEESIEDSTNPVFFICDEKNPRVSGLVKHCHVIYINPPSTKNIVERLKTISNSESWIPTELSNLEIMKGSKNLNDDSLKAVKTYENFSDMLIKQTDNKKFSKANFTEMDIENHSDIKQQPLKTRNFNENIPKNKHVIFRDLSFLEEREFEFNFKKFENENTISLAKESKTQIEIVKPEELKQDNVFEFFFNSTPKKEKKMILKSNYSGLIQKEDNDIKEIDYLWKRNTIKKVINLWIRERITPNILHLIASICYECNKNNAMFKAIKTLEQIILHQRSLNSEKLDEKHVIFCIFQMNQYSSSGSGNYEKFRNITLPETDLMKESLESDFGFRTLIYRHLQEEFSKENSISTFKGLSADETKDGVIRAIQLSFSISDLFSQSFTHPCHYEMNQISNIFAIYKPISLVKKYCKSFKIPFVLKTSIQYQNSIFEKTKATFNMKHIIDQNNVEMEAIFMEQLFINGWTNIDLLNYYSQQLDVEFTKQEVIEYKKLYDRKYLSDHFTSKLRDIKEISDPFYLDKNQSEQLLKSYEKRHYKFTIFQICACVMLKEWIETVLKGQMHMSEDQKELYKARLRFISVLCVKGWNKEYLNNLKLFNNSTIIFGSKEKSKHSMLDLVENCWKFLSKYEFNLENSWNFNISDNSLKKISVDLSKTDVNQILPQTKKTTTTRKRKTTENISKPEKKQKTMENFYQKKSNDRFKSVGQKHNKNNDTECEYSLFKTEDDDVFMLNRKKLKVKYN